jgi:2-methylcitrate dehydratase PrpD
MKDEASLRLAGHVARSRYEDLPAEVVHALKRALLDHVTCALAGSAMPVSRALLSYYQETDASRVATVIGAEARLSAPNAALVNGANTHGLDFDDGTTHGSAHPSGAIFPAVLAAAEQHGADAKAVILAATLGYDVMVRIAAAMHPVTAKRGFHNTPLAGVFGAAAAVAKLLNLDSAGTNHALGLAGSFAGGIRQYLEDGAEVKRIHPGKAARDGMLCAEFARRGITGPARVLEGRYGFADTHAGGEFKWDRLLGELGSRWEIAGIYFKPYPCCRHYHSAIDGIVALREEHGIRPQDVESLRIGLYSVGVNGHDHKHCDNILDAQMSAPVGAALAVVDGAIAAHQFLPDSLARPDVRRIVDLVDTRLDEECERLYPARRSGAVEIGLKGGKKVAARVLDPKGEGENPMSDADLERKFFANCEPVIGKQRCAEVLKTVWSFDGERDATGLLRLL